MKPTLVEIVQDILSDADGDEVNSIGDTIESLQAAKVVRQCYNSIVEEFDLQGEKTAFQLEPVSPGLLPTHMSLPANVFNVTLLRYDNRTIPYSPPEEFLDLVGQRGLSEPQHQAVMDPTGVSVVILNNRPPAMWTSLDGARTIVFDGFESEVEASLQAHKTQGLGMKKRELILESSAEVDLPDTLHQLLFNEAREMFFELYKDGAPRKVNEAARRSRVRAKERTNKISTPVDTLPDYGRKRRG